MIFFQLFSVLHLVERQRRSSHATEEVDLLPEGTSGVFFTGLWISLQRVAECVFSGGLQLSGLCFLWHIWPGMVRSLLYNPSISVFRIMGYLFTCNCVLMSITFVSCHDDRHFFWFYFSERLDLRDLQWVQALKLLNESKPPFLNDLGSWAWELKVLCCHTWHANNTSVDND